MLCAPINRGEICTFNHTIHLLSGGYSVSSLSMLRRNFLKAVQEACGRYAHEYKRVALTHGPEVRQELAQTTMKQWRQCTTTMIHHSKSDGDLFDSHGDVIQVRNLAYAVE